MFKKKSGFTTSYTDKIFNMVNPLLMIIMLFIFVWPLWFVLIASISNPVLVQSGKVLLFPRELQFDGYKAMFEYTELWRGYLNTIFYTLLGTLINLVMSICFAYPLSRTDFKPRRIFLLAFFFTMYFSGGLIPTYLVVKNVRMVNTIWAMIIPEAISVYNCLILRNYFMNSISKELQEASELDGANAAQYLIRVVLPLSKPVLAVIGLYYMVGHWNDYYSSLIYIYDTDLRPLQAVLKDLLMSSKMTIDNFSVDLMSVEEMLNREMTMKYCVIIASAIPMLCVYPFIQKFFVKGIMIGAVKG